MKAVALFLILITSSNLQAQYRYVIYTDQEPPQRAEEVREYLRNTPPFPEFHFEIDIRPLSTEDLGCESSPGIPRLVTCDTGRIMREAMNENYDQAFVISDNENYGGSGGSIPVMTSSSSVPLSTILHEYMHVLGFCDEYVYSPSDLQAYDYCAPDLIQRAVNAVEITPSAEGYPSDQVARETHSSQIPWFGHILSTTPIATTTLGTPITHKHEIGLFPSEMCQHAGREVHLWKPGGESTIMNNLHDPVGALEPLLREALRSIGLRAEGEPEPESLIITIPSHKIDCTSPESMSILSKNQKNHIEKLYQHLTKIP